MQLRVLGPVEVAAAGRRVTVGSDHQRLILAVLLAARERAVSADRLVDAVWGADPPPSARRSLHTHVSRLRRTLTAAASDDVEVVVTEPAGYRVDLERHDLDARHFEAALARARQALDADPQRAVHHLDEALGLWRGPAFGELAEHEFVRAEAVRLDGLRAVAVAERIDAQLAMGDHRAVIGDLEAAVAAEPLAERHHGQLMLALYRSGRQAEALEVYRRLQRLLGEEVGVDPSPEVRDLHERILRQDPELAATRRLTISSGDQQAAASRGDDDAPTPLVDRQPGTLLGRDDDVAALTTLVADTSLVTLTGPGGVGKSRLAEEVAAEARHRFEDMVVGELAAVRDPASVTAALIEALGLQHKGDRSPEETVLAALGSRRLLLVLDNCEHLLGEVAPLVDRIRGRCPHVAILVTSREYLHLPDERVWEVAPLPLPRRDASAAEVAASPAGALLCRRARAVEPSFELTDANAATIAELCRRLDGIPLAIELAAARIRALAPGELAERIDHRFQVLTGGSHQQAGRHRTLQAVVDWSYELLTDAEARLFDRLSVFAGAFPLTAVERVCAGEPLIDTEVAGVLAELVDKSLVVVERGQNGVRYRLLDTLRAYGAQRLEGSGAAEDVRAAHATYHVLLAEALGPQARGPDEGDALARIDEAVDDLRVAQAWLADTGDVDRSLRLPAALHDHLTFQPRAEVFAWAEAAVELPGAAQHQAYPGAMATAARGMLNRGELDRARDTAEAAVAAAKPDSLAVLWALYLLTNVALYEGRLDDVLALAERRLALADALGQDYHRALAGVSRVLALMYRGDADAAALAAIDARDAAEASGNHTARAWALYSSGEALLETDPTEAAVLLEQAIEAAGRVDRPFIEGVALVSLASLRGRAGETGQALELFRETVAHWRRLGDYTHQLTTLRNLVELLTRIEADEAAAVLHGAVTAGATPSYGAEAERLAGAWAQLEQRLGTDVATAAAGRGRRLSTREMVDEALGRLDGLIEAAVTGERP